MNIEVEIRTFITKEKYEELLKFFKKEGEFLYKDDQESHYFDCEEDLRMQKNNFGAKIWMKKGVILDEQREEFEVNIKKEDFETTGKIFSVLGYNVQIKWFRKRNAFKWQGLEVMVDYSKGFGYVLELEKMSDEKNKEENLRLLKQKMKELDIEITPREEFQKHYDYYKENWRKLTS
ncbi:MAG: CYTH domain-containing protein [archaeon]